MPFAERVMYSIYWGRETLFSTSTRSVALLQPPRFVLKESWQTSRPEVSMPFQTGQTILLGFKNLSDSIRVAQAVSTLHVLSADSSDIDIYY